MYHPRFRCQNQGQPQVLTAWCISFQARLDEVTPLRGQRSHFDVCPPTVMNGRRARRGRWTRHVASRVTFSQHSEPRNTETPLNFYVSMGSRKWHGSTSNLTFDLFSGPHQFGLSTETILRFSPSFTISTT